MHRDTPHPPPGYLCWHLGSHMGNKGCSLSRASMEGQAEWRSQTKPEQPPCAAFSLQAKGEGFRCDLYYFPLCRTRRIWGVLNKCFAGKQRIEQLIIDVNHHYTFIKGNLEENYNCQYLPFSEYFSKTVCILNYTCAKGLN